MIPDKIIKTVREVIPGLSKDAVTTRLEHGIKTKKTDDPKEASLYKFCNAIKSLDLQSMEDRTAFIYAVAAGSGLSRGYVSTTLNQNDVVLPEHLSGYSRKTRGPIVAGIRDIAKSKRKNPQVTVLSIEKTLKERLVEYAERHSKSVKAVAEEALIGFLKAETKVGKRR